MQRPVDYGVTLAAPTDRPPLESAIALRFCVRSLPYASTQIYRRLVENRVGNRRNANARVPWISWTRNLVAARVVLASYVYRVVRQRLSGNAIRSVSSCPSPERRW